MASKPAPAAQDMGELEDVVNALDKMFEDFDDTPAAAPAPSVANNKPPKIQTAPSPPQIAIKTGVAAKPPPPIVEDDDPAAELEAMMQSMGIGPKELAIEVPSF